MQIVLSKPGGGSSSPRRAWFFLRHKGGYRSKGELKLKSGVHFVWWHGVVWWLVGYLLILFGCFLLFSLKLELLCLLFRLYSCLLISCCSCVLLKIFLTKGEACWSFGGWLSIFKAIYGIVTNVVLTFDLTIFSSEYLYFLIWKLYAIVFWLIIFVYGASNVEQRGNILLEILSLFKVHHILFLNGYLLSFYKIIHKMSFMAEI